MRRTVMARRSITGDPERIRHHLRTDTRRLIQRAAGGQVDGPAGDGSFLIPATLPRPWRDGPPRGDRALLQLRVRVGQVEDHDTWLRIPLQVEAAAGRPLFPRFEGGVELVRLDHVRSEVVVFGHHIPPLGAVGGLFEPLTPHEVVQHTVSLLCDGIVRGLADGLAHGQEDAAGRISGLGEPMRVADIMTREVVMAGEDTPMRAAASRMLLLGVSGMPVVDDRGTVVGVLSEGDLLDKVSAQQTGLSRATSRQLRNQAATTAGEACSRPARTTSADTTLRDVAKEMADHDVDRLVVLDDAEVVGIVTRADTLRALLRSDEEVATSISRAVAETIGGAVHVDVTDGHVTLHGKVPRRSEVVRVLVLAGQADGVVDVDGDALTYVVDDAAPPMPLV